MTNEQTNKTDTQGTTPNSPLEKDGETLSDYDKALALVKRREEATKAENEVLERKEKLAANAMLGGTGGGNVEPKLVPEEDRKKKEAAEFFKGTELERAILDEKK